MIDALVVGGGPAGNQTALSLARQGLSVTVVDHRQVLGDKLCTGIIGLECAERYQVPHGLIHHRARGASIVSPTGRVVKIEREEDQALVIDRVRFVASIADRAMASGAEYRLGSRVTSLSVEDEGVTAVVQSDGSTERLRSRSAVIASGFGSSLPRACGLSGGTAPAFAAQVGLKVDGPVCVQVFAHRYMPQGFFGWMVPASPGCALAGLIGRGKPRSALGSMLEGLRMDGAVFEQAGPVKTWGVPVRPAPVTYSDRVLLVGDVAGQVKPTTGGGIYYALRSADIAGAVLGPALVADDLSAAALRPYEEQWKAMLGRELRLGYIARRIYERLGARELDRLLSLTGANGLLGHELKFDWHGDLVIRALGYRLFESILGPLTRIGRRVDVGADG